MYINKYTNTQTRKQKTKSEFRHLTEIKDFAITMSSQKVNEFLFEVND